MKQQHALFCLFHTAVRIWSIERNCAGVPCTHESWTKQTFQALWESLKENMWKTDSSKSTAGSEGHSPGRHWPYCPGIGLASLFCSWSFCSAQSVQFYLTLCEPRDYSLPGSPVHGILQARILEWAVMPSSRGSSLPRDWTRNSWVSCISGRFFFFLTATTEALFCSCWSPGLESLTCNSIGNMHQSPHGS